MEDSVPDCWDLWILSSWKDIFICSSFSWPCKTFFFLFLFTNPEKVAYIVVCYEEKAETDAGKFLNLDVKQWEFCKTNTFVMTVHIKEQWPSDVIFFSGSLQWPSFRADLQWSVTDGQVHFHHSVGKSHHNPHKSGSLLWILGRKKILSHHHPFYLHCD